MQVFATKVANVLCTFCNIDGCVTGARKSSILAGSDGFCLGKQEQKIVGLYYALA